MNKKVAILQNRFQKGGRMQVTISMIKALNKRGIVPDLVTFKFNLSKKEISEKYDTDVDFNVKEIFVNLRMPFEWNILVFNFLSRFYLKSYDLVINSNNTSYFLLQSLNLISYVHFPRKKRAAIPKKDIHFPEGKNKSLWDFKSDFLLLAKLAYRFNKSLSSSDLQIANSEFTQNTLQELYGIGKSEVQIIYPPVTPMDLTNESKKMIVSSLGRFSPDKRQLEQVKIAEQLPHLQFKLFGFVNSENYYQTIESYIAKNKIMNVELYPNASFDEIRSGLSESTFFLHSLQNEPFGITTVQAIQLGCIPVVHNSGGQIEIVHNKDLRYNKEEEVVSIFNKLSALDENQLDTLRESFSGDAKKYTNEIFINQFNRILDSKL